MGTKEKVIIVGGGFAGLNAAKRLSSDYEVLVIDKSNHNLFQPLLYQVATGALSPSEIATPLRHTLRKKKNVSVLLNEMTGLDPVKKKILLKDGREEEYSKLILAGGAEYNYFGNDEWNYAAPALKNISDALKIRGKIFHAFEKAENNPEKADEYLTFVIVGGGATGVELAGQIIELARHGMKNNFVNINPGDARVIILDAADEVMSMMGEKLSIKAHKQLDGMGIQVENKARVINISKNKIVYEQNHETKELLTRNVIWAAGVKAAGLSDIIQEGYNGELPNGPGGRILVNDHCQVITKDDENINNVKINKDIFVIGDMHTMKDNFFPGLATVAMQQGKYVANYIMGKTSKPFHYFDKGSLATIGRNRAVGTIFGLKISGFSAWLVWLFIHLRYLAGIQNRIIVVIRWLVNYVTFGRSTRLITYFEDE